MDVCEHVGRADDNVARAFDGADPPAVTDTWVETYLVPIHLDVVRAHDLCFRDLVEPR